MGISRSQSSVHRRASRGTCRRGTCGWCHATWAAPAASAIRNGESVATTMGMSPQSGLPQSNRVGDFDPFAIPWIMQRTGMSLDEVLTQLATQSGLLGHQRSQWGYSRTWSPRPRQATAGHNWRSTSTSPRIRRHLGGLLVELGGADMLVFTGGIGENSVRNSPRRVPGPAAVGNRAGRGAYNGGNAERPKSAHRGQLASRCGSYPPMKN